ncbi:ATP-dependent Clp protease proteolytic subunit 4 [Ancistrocladus abbreviatus]
MLSISAPLSPLNPSLFSLKLRKPHSKSFLFKPQSTPILYSRSISSTLCNSLQFSHPTSRSNYFDTLDHGFNGMGLGATMGAAATTPQTPATAMRGAESDAMGLLLRERIVFLGNNIDDFVADAIISQLLLLDAQDHTKDIRLFINSPGGSLSGKKGKRLAMPNTRIMLHQPLGGASGQAIDVEIQAREITHNKNNVTRLISEFTGRSFEQVEKDIDRDRYMSPIEAVEYGLIDGVIDRDSIISLAPVPERVKSTLNYEEISKDPRKFLTPDIPDDEIY